MPRGLEHVRSRVASPQHMTGPGRSTSLGSLQRNQCHRGRQSAEQPRTQAAGRRLQFLQPLPQAPAAQTAEDHSAAALPLRFQSGSSSSNIRRSTTSRATRDAKYAPVRRPVRCLVDGATRTAHAVKHSNQAQVRPVAQDRVGVFALVRDLSQIEAERDGRPGRRSWRRRRPRARCFAHTELPIESMIVP